MRSHLALAAALFSACTLPDGAASGERNAAYERCRDTPDDEACRAGTCPAGERCSFRAPGGLRFRGAIIADQASRSFLAPDETPKSIATGGHQLIRFDATALGSEVPLIAGSTDDQVLTIVAGPTVVDGRVVIHVRGLGVGQAALRIEDDIGLLDRITLQVQAIDRVEVGPLLPRQASDHVFPGFEPERLGFDRWTILGDRPAFLYARLFAGTTRVVDQALADIRAPTSTRTIVRADWETIPFMATAAATTVPLGVRAGHMVVGFDIAVADGIDTIALVGIGTVPSTEVKSRFPCVLAQRAGRAVITADWRFRGEGGVVVEASSPGAGYACAALAESSAKTGTLVVEAGEASATFPVRIP